MNKRPGTMTDDDRALIGREHRRASSQPAADEFDDDHTPVGVIMERLEVEIEIGGSLSPRERRIIQAFGRHTANMEMRARQRRETGDTAALERRLDSVEKAIIDIRGEGGNNGKLGEQRRRLEKIEARRWWAVTFLATTLVTVIGAAIAFGRWMSSVEMDVDWLKQQRRRPAMFQPAPAGKDQP